MLKAMRKNVKKLSPILWLVIAAFIITIFAVWGGAGRLGETRTTGAIVTIGKERISADFYFQNLRQRLEGLKREFKDLDSKLIQQLNIPRQVLEQIIQQTLLSQKMLLRKKFEKKLSVILSFKGRENSSDLKNTREFWNGTEFPSQNLKKASKKRLSSTKS
jgi:hypothetical protein